MIPHDITLFATPRFSQPPRLLMGFSGWMDGGEVSTGTIDYLISEYQMEPLGVIHPDTFYIYNMPGGMDAAALHRPISTIENGLVTRYQEPENRLFYSEQANLIVLRGREPDFNWRRYCDCLFEIVRQCGVHSLYFAGSFAGMAPHTREPRVTAVISTGIQGELVSRCNMKLAQYEGPSSIVTYMIRQASGLGLDMISMIAEIPPYIQGRNPRCIEALLRRLARLLDLDLELAELRLISDEVEKRLNRAVAEREDLTEHIIRLEEAYDKDVFESNMPDLKQWLIDKGIRLD